MGEVSSEDGDRAGGSEPWQPQSAAERGPAERGGDARGEWPKVAQACKRELVAEAADLAPLASRPAGRAAGSCGRGARPGQSCAQPRQGGGAEAASGRRRRCGPHWRQAAPRPRECAGPTGARPSSNGGSGRPLRAGGARDQRQHLEEEPG
eukprot:120068-Pyramimonas_sp.AAC.1